MTVHIRAGGWTLHVDALGDVALDAMKASQGAMSGDTVEDADGVIALQAGMTLSFPAGMSVQVVPHEK